MKTTFISKEKNTVKFTMEFTAEEFENAQIKAYQRTKNQYSIDGFRKGKAPRKLIEKHYGEGVFFEDAINDMFNVNYPLALDELMLDVIDRPDADFTDFKKGEGFTATITVDVAPVPEVKDYKGIEIKKVKPEPVEEKVQAELEAAQKRNARLLVAERPAENGDTLTLDYAGFVGDDQFAGGTAEMQQLTLGSGQFIPGFEDQLVGVKAGEEKEVKVTFPEEYHAPELAGKEAVFKCKVHEIKYEELPELNDDFAQEASEFDTLDEWKKDLTEKQEKVAAEKAETDMKNAVIEKLVEATKVDVPAVMIDDEAAAMINNFAQQLSYQGLSLDMYMKYLGKDINALKEEMKPEAEKSVKTRLVVTAVGEAEKIEVSQEDMDKELQFMADSYKMDVEKVKEILGPDSLAAIKKDLRMRNIVEFLYKNAKIK